MADDEQERASGEASPEYPGAQPIERLGPGESKRRLIDALHAKRPKSLFIGEFTVSNKPKPELAYRSDTYFFADNDPNDPICMADSDPDDPAVIL